MSQNNYEMIQDFSYFIAGYIYALNTYSAENHCQFINDGNLLYTRMKLKKHDLIELDKNLNKLITFKTFLFDVTTLEHLNGKINALIIDFQNYFTFLKADEFDTKIYIKHNFEYIWKPSCFSTLNNYKIFNLFTFFKVIEVKINFETKYAELKLDVVGKAEIFENKLGIRQNANNRYVINYDNNNNRIEIYNSNFD